MFLLILFWISFLIFNLSYLFIVLFLIVLLIVLIFVYFSRIIYLKYLVVLVYVRGVVIFILYISCLCWYQNHKISGWILFFGFFFIFYFDRGLNRRIFDIGEYLWIYIYFSLLFSRLVNIYSLLLFKVAGSLRF